MNAPLPLAGVAAVVLLASACTRDPAPPPLATTDAPPSAVPPTAPPAAPARISRAFVSDLESGEGVANLQGPALKAALSTCGADYWLAQDFQTRLQQLRALGIACKEVPHASGLQAECPLPAGTRSFGGHAALSLLVFDEGNVHETNIRVAASAEALAAAMAKDTMTELTDFGASAGMYENLLDDRYRHIVWRDAKDPAHSTLNCRMHALDAESQASAQSSDGERLPPGTISGRIDYPRGQAGEIPAMRICAIHNEGAMHGCTQTGVGQDRYQIENLAAADSYLVRADIDGAGYPVGGYADSNIRCSSPRCDAPPLLPVAVAPGQAVNGIDLAFFDEAPAWPAMPIEGE